jgi:hypothetical protein
MRMAGVVAACFVAAAGCGDACTEFATRCWNNNVQTCEGGHPAEGGPDVPFHWTQSDDCSGATCIQPAGQDAMCVLATDPDPSCAGVRSYCSGDAVVRCGSGYRVEMQTCGDSSGNQGFTKCVAADPEDAVCVPPEAMPNDACPPADSFAPAAMSVACAGNIEITCVAGLAVTTRACAVCAHPCIGFLGDICGWDGNCAAGFTCQLDSLGTLRCTAACDATDPNAVQRCEDLYTAGGPPPSLSSTPRGNSRMTCTAGFCEWMN